MQPVQSESVPDDFVIVLLTKNEKEALYDLAEKEKIPVYLFLNRILRKQIEVKNDSN